MYCVRQDRLYQLSDIEIVVVVFGFVFLFVEGVENELGVVQDNVVNVFNGGGFEVGGSYTTLQSGHREEAQLGSKEVPGRCTTECHMQGGKDRAKDRAKDRNRRESTSCQKAADDRSKEQRTKQRQARQSSVRTGAP